MRRWLQGGYKLVLPVNGTAELFNIVRDPREKADLKATDPGGVEQMREDFELIYNRRLTRVRGGESPVELSPGQLYRLRSLGYVG